MSPSRNFLLRYAPDCTFSSRKMKMLPTVGGGDTTLPQAPSAEASIRGGGAGGAVASPPMKILGGKHIVLPPPPFCQLKKIHNIRNARIG